MIAVNPRQQGNPLLKHIRNVPYQFVENIVPDFVLGSYTCCIFISLRYHLLYPQYLIRRVKELRRDYRLRVLLCLVDVEDSAKLLHELNRMALLESCTLILAWSTVEAARYLETYKAYENKSTESIQEKVDTDYMSQLAHVLTCIRSVNKTDVVTLSSTFGPLVDLMTASKQQLVQCPGLGEKKIQRLWEAFHEPFFRKPGQKRAQPTLDDILVTTKTSSASASNQGREEDGQAAHPSPMQQQEEDPLDHGSDQEDVELLAVDDEGDD